MRADKTTRNRRTYIGGHDAARIGGVFPYGAGPADTYARIVHGTTVEMNARMWRGLAMEDGFATWVAEQRGISNERDVFYVDDDIPFFAGSIDALEPGERVGHEFTTTSSMNKGHWGVPGTDDAAKHKWVQAQWYMGIVPTIREVHVWVYFVDGDDMPSHYIVPRNEVAIAELRERSEAFWYDHILPRIPPIPGVGDVHDPDANAALQALFPTALGAVVDADATLVELAQRYAVARLAEKIGEAEKSKVGAQLKALLGDHKGARWSGGSVSWTSRSIGEKTNWEAIAYELAQKNNTPGEVFSGLVRENTFQAQSVRALRVSVKGIK